MPQMRSVIDNKLNINDSQWALSLVVKPQGKNPEHAILLVEGVSKSAVYYTFRRYDFVIDVREQRLRTASNPTFFDDAQEICHTTQSHPGLVLIKTCNDRPFNQTQTHMENEHERKRFFLLDIMRDLLNKEGVKGISWLISPQEAENLHQSVLLDKECPPIYHIAGNNAFLPKTLTMSGHNCYTWARDQIFKLNIKSAQEDERLKLTLSDLWGARTSLHINMLPIVENGGQSTCFHTQQDIEINNDTTSTLPSTWSCAIA